MNEESKFCGGTQVGVEGLGSKSKIKLMHILCCGHIGVFFFLFKV
jgi:hypothetical protein